MYSSRKKVSESKRCEIQGSGIKSEKCSKGMFLEFLNASQL